MPGSAAVADSSAGASAFSAARSSAAVVEVEAKRTLA
jgi:hypothetical protein